MHGRGMRFLGVFARDEIPKPQQYTSCLIANTDEADQPGMHWVAIIYLAKKKTEFFDSFAFAPITYNVNLPNAKSSAYRIQSTTSTVCGQFCLFYLYYRSLGHSMFKIYTMFSPNYIANDTLVRTFVRLAKRNTSACFSCQCPHSQTCTSYAKCYM